MTVIAVWSAKGSPGVTTTVAALAASWPEDRPLFVIEADPSGGDLALWLDRPAEPGLVTLAAAGRRGVDRSLIDAHSQPLRRTDHSADGLGALTDLHRRVLLGPVATEQATAALSVLRTGVVESAGTAERDVIIDCGRLDLSSPAVHLLAVADRTLAVCRPRIADVHHLATRVQSLQLRDVGELLMVGQDPYDVAEVSTIVGLRPFGAVAVDAKAAATLAGEHPAGERLLRRSHLLRSVRDIAAALVRDRAPLQPPAPMAPPPPVTPPVAPGAPS